MRATWRYTEPRDHRVVGDSVAHHEAVTGIAAAQPFDHPARADAVRVGVDQQSQQHLRRERRLPRAAQLVVGFERAQAHHRRRVDDQVDDVALRQPVHHVGRKQEGLTSFRFTKMVRHRVVRVVGEQRSNRASPEPSRPKRTKTRHHDVLEAIMQQALHSALAIFRAAVGPESLVIKAGTFG